jgi:N-glycosylase/DNA lyase
LQGVVRLSKFLDLDDVVHLGLFPAMIKHLNQDTLISLAVSGSRMSQERIEQVADTLASVGYEGIVKFDRTEPEYGFMLAARERFDNDTYIALLCILATTQDYQLSGDAQRFWQTLETVIEDYESLESVQDVNEVLADFMEQPVNVRLNNQKKDRLVRIQNNGFGEWFVENHPDVDPVRVWEELADALETTMEKKTVVLSVKVYDIFNLIATGQYLELPTDVPIPCDLQVERVAAASGIVENEEKGPVMDAWARVMEAVNAELDRPVSMLRIDSIVWQAGQIISDNDDRQEPSRQALIEYFEEVGLNSSESERLARELTLKLDS